MDVLQAASPVFTDDSGRRLTLLQWLARGFCLAVVLAMIGVGFTLLTRVPLPGLGGLLPAAPHRTAPRAAPDPAADAIGARGSAAARLATPARSVRAVSAASVRRQAVTAQAHTRRASGAATSQGAAAPGGGSTQPSVPVSTPAAAPATSPPASPATTGTTPGVVATTRNPKAAARKPTSSPTSKPTSAGTGRTHAHQGAGATTTPQGLTK